MAENFKVGDKVELTEDYHNFKQGTQGTVTHIDTYSDELLHVATPGGYSLRAFSFRFKKVEDNAPTYRVGQRVRVIADTNCSNIPLGTIVTLIEEKDDPDFKWRTDYTKVFRIGSQVTESDIAPVEDALTEVDPEESYPQVGDEVTLRYLPTDQEFTSTVHESDYGYSVLGWSLPKFDNTETYADAFADGDATVVRVLRTATPEPEPEKDPTADNHKPGTILKGSPSYGSGPSYLFKVREGYEEKRWDGTVAEWRAFYEDGSTGMWAWEDIQAGLFGETEMFAMGRGDN